MNSESDFLQKVTLWLKNRELNLYINNSHIKNLQQSTPLWKIEIFTKFVNANIPSNAWY